ncbi:MAG TPA: hypothetical protein VFZ61_14030, partial [Polyangiales bacterium]
MRASITCGAGGFRKMRWVMLACALGLPACKEPTWRTLSSGLRLRVLPECAPERAEQVLVEPLGYFAASPDGLRRVALGTEPVRLGDLPPDSQAFRLSLEQADFRGLSLAAAADQGQQFDALLLPEQRTCSVLDEGPGAPQGSAQALLAGSDLLIAGGHASDTEPAAEASATVVRVARAQVEQLGEEQRPATDRTGAAAVDLGAETWLIGGASSASAGAPAYAHFERYDVASARFTGAVERMRVRRYRPAALRLVDGSVLVAGGSASVGGVPQATLETLAADGESSVLWDAALPFESARLAMLLRDDGRVLAYGQSPDGTFAFALLDPPTRTVLELELRAPGSAQLAAGVSLPGARVALFELTAPDDPAAAEDLDAWISSGRVQLLLDGASDFLSLFETGWLGSFAGMRRLRALALPDGRVLLTGVRGAGAEPVAHVLNLSNREVATRALDLSVDALFLRADGSALLVGEGGVRVLREGALSRFDNPGGTLIADDSQVLCLDAYGRFAREGLGLRATEPGARFDLAPLRYLDLRIELSV